MDWYYVHSRNIFNEEEEEGDGKLLGNNCSRRWIINVAVLVLAYCAWASYTAATAKQRRMIIMGDGGGKPTE